ncbi:MAG: apolipoprotein N-acyltransferase [Candidatus Azotimanducaceae bacterium]|jgi:apolipoprotein N-acyltransferase
MKWLLAPLLGASFSLALAPFDMWWCAVVSVVGLYALCTQHRHQAATLAWAYGLGKFGLGASWVYVSIHVYGNASPALAGLLVVLFTMLTAALFCLPLGWLFSRLGNKFHSEWVGAFLFIGLWGLLDWTATWLLTGFPWLFVGNGLLETWLSGWTPVGGVLTTNTLFVASAVLLVVAWRVRTLKLNAALALASSLLPWLLGAWLQTVTWVTPVAEHSVALVQGNLDQAVKWQPDQAMPNVRRHLDLSADHWDADLIIWPEAAVTLYPQQAQRLLESLAEQSATTETALIFGIPGVEQVGEGYEYQNLAMGLGLARGRYAKQHLVPFGEYVPFAFVLRGLIDFFDLPMSSSSPGAMGQPNIKAPFGEIAMAICYEVAYPDSLRLKAKTAAVLATISNDTWFGSSIGPLQHMQLAQVRALENGRWMLRSTNNGVTGIIDPRGNITQQLPQFEAATLRGNWWSMQGSTPYTQYGHLMFFILVGLCLAPLISGIFAPRIASDK